MGEWVGAAIRAVVEALQFMFSGFFGALDSFFEGVMDTLGINPSLFSVLLLGLGLLMLYWGVRAFMRRAIVAGVLWLLLALILLRALIS